MKKEELQNGKPNPTKNNLDHFILRNILEI